MSTLCCSSLGLAVTGWLATISWFRGFASSRSPTRGSSWGALNPIYRDHRLRYFGSGTLVHGPQHEAIAAATWSSLSPLPYIYTTIEEARAPDSPPCVGFSRLPAVERFTATTAIPFGSDLSSLLDHGDGRCRRSALRPATGMILTSQRLSSKNKLTLIRARRDAFYVRAGRLSHSAVVQNTGENLPGLLNCVYTGETARLALPR